MEGPRFAPELCFPRSGQHEDCRPVELAQAEHTHGPRRQRGHAGRGGDGAAQCAALLGRHGGTLVARNVHREDEPGRHCFSKRPARLSAGLVGATRSHASPLRGHHTLLLGHRAASACSKSAARSVLYNN